eukprot:m.44769 g.44769  ORF g.44769 m.44769 type:complete len:114 (+) comp14592_c0_seq3:393-734(+)
MTVKVELKASWQSWHVKITSAKVAAWPDNSKESLHTYCLSRALHLLACFCDSFGSYSIRNNCGSFTDQLKSYMEGNTWGFSLNKVKDLDYNSALIDLMKRHGGITLRIIPKKT